MRKIALLAIAAFVAACGSSSSTPDPVVQTGKVRFANLSPSYGAVDYCIKPVGGAYSTPILATLGAASGLVYGGYGDEMISSYVPFNVGTYTVAVFDKNVVNAGCASPAFTLDITIGADTKSLVALIGQTGVAGGAPTLRKYTDTTSFDAANVIVRFVNVGFLPYPDITNIIPLVPYDVGYQLSGGNYTTILTGIAYPGTATGPVGGIDANGYATVSPSILGVGSVVYSCMSGVSPPSPMCQTIQLPQGFTITGGIVASAFNIGIVGMPPMALFCGDNQPPPFPGYQYSMCTTGTTPATPVQQ